MVRPAMKLREIERLRAMAILMVMVVHWDTFQKLLPDVADHSWSGVDLFFVISGFVVTLSLVRLLPALDGEATFLDAFERAKQALKTFYTRRFFRIMPAALAALLIDRFMMTVFPQNFGTPKGWFAEVVAFYGGVYNYAHAYHAEYRMGVYWSLAVEEHFYLILPVLFVALRTTNRRLLGAFVVGSLSILARALPHPDGVDVDYYEKFASHLRFDSLMAGVALALVASKVVSAPIMPKWLMRFFVMPAALVLIACLPGAAPDYVMRREGFIALWFLSAVLVGFASLDRGYVLALPGLSQFLEYIGSRSYALYLLHTMAGRFEDDLGQQWPEYRALVPQDVTYPWKRAIVVFAIAVLAAEVLHRVVERPFMRLGAALIDPERRAALRFTWRAKTLLAAAAVLALLYDYRHGIMIALGPRDLAYRMPVAQSSHEDGKPWGEALVNGVLEPEYGMHTKMQESPWVTIDLGRPRDIGTIRVYNRADGSQDQQLQLEVSVS
ncbi:MAG TPA: acyltransferase family protein, partial [Polyangiaceae bacterium]|nr:acyltransferase family protein [Polyangiaceae bacterium]